MIATPAAGLLRLPHGFACHECRVDLRNFAVYPFSGPRWRCVNRACAQCAIPAAAPRTFNLAGLALLPI